ncbi:hypothetical protein MASR2M78_24960 [Treponema sp.]
MKKDKNLRYWIFLIIRTFLILSILINLLIVTFAVLQDDKVSGSEILVETSKRMEWIFWALLTFILTFGSGVLEKQQKIDIPDILEIVIVLFIYAGIFLSARYNLYYRFFWWDDLLHFFSGIIMGFIGFIVIYKLNRNYSMDLSPIFVALFAFSFAVTLGVFWEILEFSADVVLGTAHQKWNLPDTEIMMGYPHQGSGLRDTMSDLILNSVGAFITSLITYYIYKNRRKSVLEEMKKMIVE